MPPSPLTQRPYSGPALVPRFGPESPLSERVLYRLQLIHDNLKCFIWVSFPVMCAHSSRSRCVHAPALHALSLQVQDSGGHKYALRWFEVCNIHVLFIRLSLPPSWSFQVFITSDIADCARSWNLLERHHSRSCRTLYSSPPCKSIPQATSRASGLPNHRKSSRNGRRHRKPMAQVRRLAQEVRSVRRF